MQENSRKEMVDSHANFASPLEKIELQLEIFRKGAFSEQDLTKKTDQNRTSLKVVQRRRAAKKLIEHLQNSKEISKFKTGPFPFWERL